MAAVSQMWRSDPPLVAIFLLVIGACLPGREAFVHKNGVIANAETEHEGADRPIRRGRRAVVLVVTR